MGISGSGKSTLGVKLYSFLKENHVATYLIDGDEVRNFFNNDLGYTKEDRIENIKRIILSAYLLDKNNIVTIVCNISPFEELRLFCRGKINNYKQIYLRKNLKESMQKDVKKMYVKNYGKTSLVGVEITFEEPAVSDLRIDVDKLSVNESFEKLIHFVKQNIKL